MPEREPKQTSSGQGEGFWGKVGKLVFPELPGRGRMELAKKRVLDLRKREKEIADQLPEAYEKYKEELCSFLGIDPETRLAEGAEEILNFADKENLDPRMFTSRLVATIEGAQRIIDKGGEESPISGTAEWSYLQAVRATREQKCPSSASGLVYSYLREAIGISREEKAKNPTMLNRCQHAVYWWVNWELCHWESFWWVIVGEPK